MIYISFDRARRADSESDCQTSTYLTRKKSKKPFFRKIRKNGKLWIEKKVIFGQQKKHVFLVMTRGEHESEGIFQI